LSDKGIKVTDKRMFTPSGELREEFRFVEESGGEEDAAASSPATAAEPAPAAAPPRTPEPPAIGPALELPDLGPALQAPSFFDLVAILAEPVSLYLGDARLPDGRTMENLEMARLHIDLLAVLRDKTAGNLTTQELAFLEDLLYRLRVRYVQKQG
jgi:hypothetical protein